MYFLGIDVGTSSVKTTVFDAEKGISVGKASFPSTEQRIDSEKPGWAEQDPETWWSNFTAGYAQILSTNQIDPKSIAGIGISYQMHGLVALDKTGRVVRKSIIWCDGRAARQGETAFQKLGPAFCQKHLLNSPGNFTASKLKWVEENEPSLFAKIHSFMLPGDYIAYRLSGEMTTTPAGLSEGILWDYVRRKPSTDVLDAFGLDHSLIPAVVPNIGIQCVVSEAISLSLGLRAGVPITYRAGDQPNNAFSLGIQDPGQIAATAGTSGVIYAISDQDVVDPSSRFNTFVHVGDTPSHKRNGILICVNGTGALYSWLNRLFSVESGRVSYTEMNNWASKIKPGSEGVLFFPFGNGAERILGNQQVHASLHGLEFNSHHSGHIVRAGMEGIVYALQMGFSLLHDNNFVQGENANTPHAIRAGNANLFLSETFRTIFANVTGKALLLLETDGAEGAARGAAVGSGFYSSSKEAFQTLKVIQTINPEPHTMSLYQELFGRWKSRIETFR
ncbi:MAG: FGGY family carbohydrate kinase [Bacteroidetes bacterium]|nr:FGGY family carbohydrate kinase [Bacteroidota bacterium]